MSKILLSVAALSIIGLTSGCVSNASKGGIQDGAGIFSTNGEETPIASKSLKILVPGDPGIIRPSTNAVVGDLVISNYSATYISNAAYGRVFIDNKQADSFIVHARTDNGVAGSGVKYKVKYNLIKGNNGGYTVEFQPQSRSEYQQGLIGKFPVPAFNEQLLRKYLKSFTLRYKFEIDTEYGSDATMANFMRLATVKNDQRGYSDPVTGKIYKQYFQINHAENTANYTVQVFPYRNGSKAVINMELPVVESNDNIVNFEQIIYDLRTKLTAIAQS